MSEEEEKPKSKSLASKIFYGIIAIVSFILAIYYIMQGKGKKTYITHNIMANYTSPYIKH